MALTRIKASNITDGTVVAAEIADDAIVADKIANNAVTDAKISAVAASKLTGTIATARLGTGASGTTFLRGDSTYATAGSTSASDLTSGTLPDARFPATLPAASGVNLTALNATNLGSGTVPTARLGTGTANSSVHLRGDGTWAAASATDIKFSACLASDHSNVTGDGTGWHSNDPGVSWSTPIINSGNGFSGGLFTVPSGGAGTYLFNFCSWMAGISSSHTEAYGYIRTSNRYYDVYHSNPYASFVGANASQTMQWSVIADMDVGDVCYARMGIYNGAKTVDMRGTGSFDYADTYFQGVLLA